MSEEVFYRVHWNWGSYPFDADHAWSYKVGPLAGDLSREECLTCSGTGTAYDDPFSDDGTCSACGGKGSTEADRGYSCCTSPEDLLASIAQFGSPEGELTAARVVIFEGSFEGYGLDGEALSVPSRIIRVMTWDEFKAENQ